MMLRALARCPSAARPLAHSRIACTVAVAQAAATCNTVLAAHSSPVAAAAAAATGLAPRRCFAALATPKSGAKGGKAKAAAVAAEAAAALERENAVSVEDQYNLIPPIPKPSAADLEQFCLNEEQLRFAKRPMPDFAQRRAILPAIYVPEHKRIMDHDASDLGLYFPVPESMQRAVPPQIQRAMATEFMGGGGFMMVRPAGLQVVEGLKKIHAGGKMKKRVFGVRGASGCGKSAALHYAIQYVREQSAVTPEKPWLLIATRGQEFPTEKRGFIAPSTVRPGIYDQPLYTMDYFARMLITEEAALKLITLKRIDKLAGVVWPDGGTAEGKTLYDLVSLASTDREQAPRLLYDFVAELRLDTEVPVCVVIDNLNSWDQVSEFIEPFIYKPLDPYKLALVDAFSYFKRAAPKNGASVWALGTRHATLTKSFAHFQPATVQGVDAYHYTTREFKHAIVHYSVSEFILSEVNPELVVRVAALTGRVPRDVHMQAYFR